MVSQEKEYEYVTTQIIKHVERSVDAFKTFAQLFSAIIGGCIWLSLQVQSKPALIPSLEKLSDALVVLVTVIFCVMVFDDYRAWRNFRDAQTKLVPHVPGPSWQSQTSEATMIACMIAGAILFCLFNPFSLIQLGK